MGRTQSRELDWIRIHSARPEASDYFWCIAKVQDRCDPKFIPFKWRSYYLQKPREVVAWYNVYVLHEGKLESIQVKSTECVPSFPTPEEEEEFYTILLEGANAEDW